MATKWQDAIGPQSIWGIQDNVLDHIENILEARLVAEYHFLEKVGQELDALNSSLESLLYPTRVVKGKLDSEPNPLADLWRSTFIGQFIGQFVSLIENEFTSGKGLYERLRQEMETFRTGAQAIKNSRPVTADVDQLEQSLETAVRRCENAKEIYESRCKEFQTVHSKPKSRLGSLKSSKHTKSASTSSLLSMDDPGINTADHDYRKAIVVANALREQRIAIYRSGYPTLQNSTERTLELVKAVLVVHASLETERSSSRTQHYEGVVDKLMKWKPVKDASDLCAFVPHEQGLHPPEIFRHDSMMGWMKRVVFCVPISYLPCNQQGVPKLLDQCFALCSKILQKSNWDEQEAAHFASTPKLSASRFEEVIIAVEKDDSDISFIIRSIPEALGLMNYLFFSLPRPLLQLSSTLATDPDLCRTWWESSRDKRKVSDLFRTDTLDKVSECTLRFLLESIASILPHARNLHIVDVAMAWAKPLFQNPRPSNAEVTALCVLFRQALLFHHHEQDERWHALWSKASLQRSGTLVMMGSSASSNGTLTQRPSRQPTLMSKSAASSPISRQSALSRQGTNSKMI